MTEQILKYIKELCNTPSPTGYTKRAEKYLIEEFRKMGYEPYQTVKGNVIVPINPGTENGLLMSAHVDTLGLMVRSIKANGRLRVTTLGGFPLSYVEQENVTIITRSGKEYTGVMRINNPAVHGSNDPREVKRDDINMEVVIDEITNSAEETEKLDIAAGDFIALDPRYRVDNGFVKSRHLDDKASAGVLMALAKEIKEKDIKINRPLYFSFTIYEEVGHGAASGHPGLHPDDHRQLRQQFRRLQRPELRDPAGREPGRREDRGEPAAEPRRQAGGPHLPHASGGRGLAHHRRAARFDQRAEHPPVGIRGLCPPGRGDPGAAAERAQRPADEARLRAGQRLPGPGFPGPRFPAAGFASSAGGLCGRLAGLGVDGQVGAGVGHRLGHGRDCRISA